MTKYIFAFACCVWLLNCRNAQPCEIEISDRFFDQDLAENKTVFTCISENRSSSIPRLIDLIDVNKKCNVGFCDATSSSFYEFSQNNFKGIKAAYLIESLIHPSEMSHGLPKTKLFGYGVIVRVVDGNPELQPLTHKDMRAIKEIYELWWMKNKSEDLVGLRRMNCNILKGSGYIWI